MTMKLPNSCMHHDFVYSSVLIGKTVGGLAKHLSICYLRKNYIYSHACVDYNYQLLLFISKAYMNMKSLESNYKYDELRNELISSDLGYSSES